MTKKKDYLVCHQLIYPMSIALHVQQVLDHGHAPLGRVLFELVWLVPLVGVVGGLVLFLLGLGAQLVLSSLEFRFQRLLLPSSSEEVFVATKEG